jgi:catalase (peroxidase I)
MKLILSQPREIRVGDLVGGRRVTSLERTQYGVLIQRVGNLTRDLFTDDHIVEIKRPDRVAMQALVQASAVL